MTDIPPQLETWDLAHIHVGRHVWRYAQLGSTNDLAARLGHDPSHHGTVILTDEQTAGRGQYGRTWQSPPGSSVLMSIVLFPPPELARPSILTAWAAVAVSEAILHATAWQAKVKWPNDVLMHGVKVCGILIEQGRAAVIGIGLNVNQTAAEFESAGLPLAGSLATVTGRSFETLEIARLLIDCLDREYHHLIRGGLATLEACWKWRLGLLGRDVVIEQFDGTRHRGRLREAAFDGLTLERADGSIATLVPEQVRLMAEQASAGEASL
jgi:BirA family biotin operon repressor/biotin-[acetyl-CoA-carboxylase] ligase